MYSIENGHEKLIKWLISKVATINAFDSNQSTPLHYAAQFSNNAEVVKILFEKGANINALSNN